MAEYFEAQMVVSEDVRYPALFSALASWTERALPLLQSRIEQRPLETRDALIWAPRLVSESFDPGSPIRALPETRVLGEVVAEMPQFANDAVTNENWRNNPLLPPIQASLKFGNFLFAYLGKNLDWGFNRRRFAKVYRDLESLLDDPDFISVAVCVELWNLSSARNKIQLADGASIRSLTTTERKRHIAQSRSTGRFGPPEQYDHYDMDPPTPGLFLELTRTVGAYKTSGLPPQHALHFGVSEDVRRAAHNMLLGLRLLTAGDFGIGTYAVATDNHLLRVDGSTALSVARDWPTSVDKKPQTVRRRPHRRAPLDTAWGSYTQTTPLGPPVVITAATARELQRLWPLLHQTRNGRLERALHRFELSYERTDPEDRLIDYWVALELLFLPDSKQELKRSASQRLAHFLETIFRIRPCKEVL